MVVDVIMIIGRSKAANNVGARVVKKMDILLTGAIICIVPPKYANSTIYQEHKVNNSNNLPYRSEG